MHPLANNIGAYIKTAAAIEPDDALGSGAIAGAAFDLQASRQNYQSMKFVTTVGVTLPSGASANVTQFIEDSANGSDWDPLDPPHASGVSVLVGLDSGARQLLTAELDVNLAGARRYIRGQAEVVFPGSGSGDAVSGIYVFGGGSYLPAGRPEDL
jgi:hypothetical protein